MSQPGRAQSYDWTVSHQGEFMPKSTFQQIPPEKQERVLREAARLFAERGFSQADVAELAARAGVSKGSLYTYFENKEALYLHVCRDGLARSRRAVYGGLRPEWELGRKLEHILHRGVAFAQSHPEYVALYINLSAAGMDQFADRLSREVEKFTADLLKSMLRQARDQGQLRPDLDVDLTPF